MDTDIRPVLESTDTIVDTVDTTDGRLQYETRGTGPAVLLIHGGISSEAFAPLLNIPELAEYRLIRYRRRAYDSDYAGSPPVDVVDDADDAFTLLTALDIDRAHVVGHSHGALVALQMAHASPSRVMRLGLLETGLAAEVPSAGTAAAAFQPAIDAFQQGDLLDAADLLSRCIFGEDYAAQMEEAGVRPSDAQIRREISATFTSDIPAQSRWSFPIAAANIRHPVLSVLGAESDRHYLRVVGAPLISEVREAVSAALPQAKHVMIPRANHLLQIAEPAAVGAALAQFFN